VPKEHIKQYQQQKSSNDHCRLVGTDEARTQEKGGTERWRKRLAGEIPDETRRTVEPGEQPDEHYDLCQDCCRSNWPEHQLVDRRRQFEAASIDLSSAKEKKIGFAFGTCRYGRGSACHRLISLALPHLLSRISGLLGAIRRVVFMSVSAKQFYATVLHIFQMWNIITCYCLTLANSIYTIVVVGKLPYGALFKF
jgi:hypothetical protein